MEATPMTVSLPITRHSGHRPPPAGPSAPTTRPTTRVAASAPVAESAASHAAPDGMPGDPASRRPLRSRETRWAREAARAAARLGLSPNAISLASVGFAAVAGGALALSAGPDAPARAGLLVLAAAAIQLRLLCNLLDGLVAVEGGKGTAAGAVYNELPDRVADLLIFVGAGASIGWVSWGWTLGWAVAVLAIMTAYVRALGASLGAGHHFAGPMAKQQRMAATTAACLASAVLASPDPNGALMTAALVAIGLGSLVTVVRRTRLVVRALDNL
jgi:phosphatidylglycerophosphate synthase